MSKNVISTSAAPSAIGPYSQAVQVDNWLFVSGQIPLDPGSGEVVDGGIEAQTKRVLDNLQAILKAAGTGLEAVVKTTIYLQDMQYFPAINAIYAQYFQPPFPARATVEVSRLPRDVLVEIDCIAKV